MTKVIFAGKFRRYHGEGWRQLLDIKTALLNIRDLLFVILGCLQSLWLVANLRPKALFIKGGFVGVPVGLASAFWHVPYITHDSDAVAGLANRIIAKWATRHAVALPERVYNYPTSKTVTVGVPIAQEYRLVDDTLQKIYKKDLGLHSDDQVLLVTGGGLGAKVINDAVTQIAPSLLARYPKLHIVHTTGHMHKQEIAETYAKQLDPGALERVLVKDYLKDMYRYSGAADVVVARAGATNMAELAMQAKACIVVPNPVLAGGHQVKNAQAFADAEAIEVISQDRVEDDTNNLYTVLTELLDSPEIRGRLGKKLHTFAHPDAAHMLAVVVLEQAK